MLFEATIGRLNTSQILESSLQDMAVHLGEGSRLTQGSCHVGCEPGGTPLRVQAKGTEGSILMAIVQEPLIANRQIVGGLELHFGCELAKALERINYNIYLIFFRLSLDLLPSTAAPSDWAQS